MAGRTPTSYAGNKEDLLRRLRRMEGQVRGLQQMIADDRYCLDVVQQINALTAAAREVALIVLEDHLRGCVAEAVREDNADVAIREMVAVLGRALRQ
jgi:CsoR family transcriptional regulator, copper-sensing transcriptional repressor